MATIYYYPGEWLIDWECTFQPEEPMKIESDKYYRTSGGKKAYVASFRADPFTPASSYPVMGYVDGYGFTRWDHSGRWSSTVRSPHDLVAEWKEPKVHKRWVAWWDYKTNPTVPFVVIYNSEDEARKNLESYKDTIVYLHGQEVTYTED
jgi:hypothetical protein